MKPADFSRFCPPIRWRRVNLLVLSLCKLPCQTSVIIFPSVKLTDSIESTIMYSQHDQGSMGCPKAAVPQIHVVNSRHDSHACVRRKKFFRQKEHLEPWQRCIAKSGVLWVFLMKFISKRNTIQSTTCPRQFRRV